MAARRRRELPPGVGFVALHVGRHFPQPLCGPGRRVEEHGDEARARIRFAFERFTRSVTELLERLVFRHHRRLIAGTRTLPRR